MMTAWRHPTGSARPIRLPAGAALLLALGTLLWVGPTAAWAQRVHTLDIQGDTIYVDGRPLTGDQLPAGLNLDGITAQYRFVGIQRPVVELKGRLYALESGTLQPVTEAEVRNTDGAVVLQGRTARAGARSAGAEAPSPRRQYFRDMQQSSRELYKRLRQEQQMEGQVHDLARVIRMLPEGPSRQAKTDTLRTLLEELFELKQQNHRREMERLQRKIQELQRRLQKRRQMRDAMIDHRLRELIGGEDGS